ncbi:MAG: hypothetical protein PUF95_04675 [Selenomonadaceae bacterium]|nr:hypothetical protein [Selenomonadaceae bacterium]
MGYQLNIDIDNLQDAAVQEFLELIAFDSPSWGEQAIASRLMAKLRELGTEPKIDKAGNIYAYFPGDEAQKPILLSAHTDTVEPSKGKEAVLLGNKNTLLTAEKTIEYFI